MLEYLLPLILLIIQIILGVISFFIKREMDCKDKQITALQDKMHKLSNKIQSQEIASEVISTKIDSILDMIEKIENKL